MPSLRPTGTFSTGAILLRVMSQRGLTASRLSDMTGLRLQTVANYVDGRRDLHPDHRDLLATALGVDPLELEPPTAIRALRRR